MEVNNAEKKASGKAPKTKEFLESEEETESEVDASDSEASVVSSSETESEAEVIIKKKAKTATKRKMSTTTKKPSKPEEKKISKKPKLEIEGEKTFNEEPVVVEADEKSIKIEKKMVNFDGGKVDKNLFVEDPNNIVQKTVQINPTLKMTCKMISGANASTSKVQYPDWAALIFQKKMKEDKCFEFNINLKDAPKIIEGLKFIIEENKTFFNN